MPDTPNMFDRELVRRHRDRAAREFAAHDFLIREVGERLTDRLMDMARSFPLALDLGARTGGFGPVPGGPGGIEQVISSDLSYQMLRQASSPAVTADLEFLPFTEGAFDLIFSNLHLHWTNDLPGSLLEICRALKPDGLFLAAIFGGETLRELLNKCSCMRRSSMRNAIRPKTDVSARPFKLSICTAGHRTRVSRKLCAPVPRRRGSRKH